MIRCLVVWALAVTMDSFSPTRAFISVDLPTFGFPMMLTNPARCSVRFSGLDIGTHLEDVYLALAEISPFAFLEAFLCQAGEIYPVKSLHIVTEGFEYPADDAVLA